MALTDEVTRLADAAERTFTERTFTGDRLSAAAQALSLLRAALERDRTPTG